MAKDQPAESVPSSSGAEAGASGRLFVQAASAAGGPATGLATLVYNSGANAACCAEILLFLWQDVLCRTGTRRWQVGHTFCILG
jgi:hypothetical protein